MGDQIRGFGFLHDGSEDTILRHLRLGGNAFTRPEFRFPKGDAQRRQVEQFVLAFDSDLAPIVGQQVTLTSANATLAAPRLDLLVARAAAGECVLTAKGVVGGMPRGWYLDAGNEHPAGMFVSDRKAEPPIADAELRAHALVPAQALTYTCAPPGQGRRVGIDRDGDGSYDADEIERGGDPADPAVVAPICGGDCNDDFRVTVDELVRGVRIALRQMPVNTCQPFDRNRDDAVAIGELITGVQSSLEGCGAATRIGGGDDR
jgi:hypothetical protein